MKFLPSALGFTKRMTIFFFEENTIFQAFLKSHQVVHRSVDGSQNGRENPTPTKKQVVLDTMAMPLII
jgi:hypothetical protein